MYYQNCSTAFEQEYIMILKSILVSGRTRNVRGYKTKELSPFSWTTSYPLRNILSNPVRKINTAFAAAEFLWIMSGRNDLEMIETYNSKIRTFSDNESVLRGAYGPQIQRQIEYILELFRQDINTRQAVIQIWQPNPGKSKDVPCTLSLQFLHDQTIDALDLIVTMRSNDAWLGLPYDVYTFTMIQNYIAMKLGLFIGRYTHNAGSEHLYDQHYDIAREASSTDEVMTSSIVESFAFKSDQLKETMTLERKMRTRFTEFNIKEASCLDFEWYILLERMYDFLEKKWRLHD